MAGWRRYGRGPRPPDPGPGWFADEDERARYVAGRSTQHLENSNGEVTTDDRDDPHPGDRDPDR